ncbi:glycosyltransferase family 4 protein (plasmid) [Paracoccus liaowanqingii]|uniref:Glycosyltransferase family 4 protein n=1 Tax=Paracoccus liaowanqingii TaxID=2560053 RepID=A0A4Y5SSN8_9RHOB|nr:glycosyltransferase [Paracoccus liaowanqingii]QDA35815.1 glycosyltransferase family 4 protein [Paracoccus liaowanqingii]
MRVAPNRSKQVFSREDTSTDPELSTRLEEWRLAGCDLLRQHQDEFSALLAPVELEIKRHRHAKAAALAQVAANHAVLWHPGSFASSRLDHLLWRLGSAALPFMAPRPKRPAGPLRVLHVVTQVSVIGGHGRMLWRWIGEDRQNRHSIALTRQTAPLPEPILRAVAAAGGSIDYVNRRIGGILDWARDLQAVFAKADLVVLHVHNQDVIPFVAMSGMAERPPVLLLNHADHVFWVGAGLVDGVISTRVSGHRLNVDRRSIPSDRNFLLPLCLDLPAPWSRTAARQALGLAEEDVVLLTVARAVKFRSLGGTSFADAICPILQADRRVRLIVIGPGKTVDWSAAETHAPGQITVKPETEDTEQFYAAADIYLDSFPFPSITSLLEAGLRGLPIVTRYAFGPGCEVMGADSVGMDTGLMRARSLRDFRHIITELVANQDRRIALGRQTMAEIRRTNMGATWRQELAGIYQAALTLPARIPTLPGNEEPRLDDLDAYLPFVFGTVLTRPSSAARLAHSRELGLKTMPGPQRLAAWGGMALRQEFAFRRGLSSVRNLVPEWLTVRLRMAAG